MPRWRGDLSSAVSNPTLWHLALGATCAMDQYMCARGLLCVLDVQSAHVLHVFVLNFI